MLAEGRHFKKVVEAKGWDPRVQLSDEQVWDLVHFTLALPTPSMLPPDVREQVYPRDRR